MRVLPILLAVLIIMAAGAAMASTTAIMLDLANWDKHFSGAWEQAADGIILYGSDYRVGNYATTKQTYNFTNSELFFKWQVNGGGSYAGYGFAIGYGEKWPLPSMIGGTGGMTTHHSWEGSYVLSEGTWYYTRLKVNSDMTLSSWTAVNDYDTNGGSTVCSMTDRPRTADWEHIDNGYIVFILGDNYGGTSASIYVSEIKTTATAVPEPSSILALLCGIGSMGRVALRRKSA